MVKFEDIAPVRSGKAYIFICSIDGNYGAIFNSKQEEVVILGKDPLSFGYGFSGNIAKVKEEADELLDAVYYDDDFIEKTKIGVLDGDKAQTLKHQAYEWVIKNKPLGYYNYGEMKNLL